MVLTKTEKKRRARERYLKTKGYAIKMAKRELKAKDVAWSLKIRENPCLVCGTRVNLNAHHILPRENMSTRHEIINGVSLCILHHKFSLHCSAHRSSALFMVLLERKRPEQFAWVQNRLDEFLKKEEPDQDIKLGLV